MGDSFDLSFSGLKTAARRIVAEARADAGLADDPDEPLPEAVVAELAWGFQDAVVDVLVDQDDPRGPGDRRPLDRARRWRRGEHGPARAARRRGRRRSGIPLIVPRPALCTDNGAMIGAAGARRFAAGERSGLDLDARPSLPLAAR